jgi:hypothetical protein
MLPPEYIMRFCIRLGKKEAFDVSAFRVTLCLSGFSNPEISKFGNGIRLHAPDWYHGFGVARGEAELHDLVLASSGAFAFRLCTSPLLHSSLISPVSNRIFDSARSSIYD